MGAQGLKEAGDDAVRTRRASSALANGFGLPAVQPVESSCLIPE